MAAWEVRKYIHDIFECGELFSIPDFGSMLWLVPVTIATKKNPEALRFILDKPTDTVTVEGVGPDDWILVCKLGCC